MTHLQHTVTYSDRQSWEFPTWVSGVAAITCGLPKSIDMETCHKVTQFGSLTRGSLQTPGVFHFSTSTAGAHLKAFPVDSKEATGKLSTLDSDRGCLGSASLGHCKGLKKNHIFWMFLRFLAAAALKLLFSLRSYCCQNTSGN